MGFIVPRRAGSSEMGLRGSGDREAGLPEDAEDDVNGLFGRKATSFRSLGERTELLTPAFCRGAKKAVPLLRGRNPRESLNA